MLDFLKEIVQGVADPSAGGTIELDSGDADAPKKRRSGKAKKNGLSDSVAEAAGEAGRKRRRIKKDEPAEEEAKMDAEAVESDHHNTSTAGDTCDGE